MAKNTSLLKFLRQPYPFYYEGSTFFKILGLLFLMGLGFNYLFRPFNVNFAEHKMNFFLISFMHTLTALLVFFVIFLVFKAFPKLSDKWDVRKEVTTLAIFLLLAGIGQFLIRDLIYDNPNNWSLGYLTEEVRNTFLVGILFISILVPTNYSWLKRQNSKRAENLRPGERGPQESTSIFIKTHLKGDDFHLRSQDFVFARSEGNYVEIGILQDDLFQTLLKRISIKDLEKQLSPLKHIIRTHRSYLVNLNFVNSVKGNAQGYRLKMHGCDEVIAVSRKMIPLFESRLEQVA